MLASIGKYLTFVLVSQCPLFQFYGKLEDKPFNTYNAQFLILWLHVSSEVYTDWHDKGVGVDTLCEDYQPNVQVKLVVNSNVTVWCYDFFYLEPINKNVLHLLFSNEPFCGGKTFFN